MCYGNRAAVKKQKKSVDGELREQSKCGKKSAC